MAKNGRRFSCGTHLYEEVEDTKDSAWIVNVMAVDDPNRIDSKLWNRIVQKCNEFGIRTAIFDCALDPYLCERKVWISSRLILALPREGLRTKEDVLMMTYFIGKQTKLQHIIDWIHRQLATRVANIETIEELENNWLQLKDKNSINTSNDIKFVFISSLATPPLILSALAIKFSGRIKFGFFRTNTEKKKSLIAKLDKRIPSYLLVLSDRHYSYGFKAGENLKYGSMELILRTLKPEMNDLFLLSILLTNLSLGLHLFWMKCSKIWKHLIYWLMNAIKYNCILFLIWLTVLTFYNFPLMTQICTFGHYLCQHLALTPMATIIRYDIQYNYKIPFLFVSFVTFGLLLAFIRRKLISSSTDDNDDHLLFRDWTPWESTLLSYILFRPINMTSFRSMATTSIDHNLEEGMELLIERLAVPNLWLQPELICSDYIKELSVWTHQTNSADTKESEVSDSDESSIISTTKTDSSESVTNELTGRSKLELSKSGHRLSSEQINSSHKSGDNHTDECECGTPSKQVYNRSPKHTKQNAQKSGNPIKLSNKRQEFGSRYRPNSSEESETDSKEQISNQTRIPDGMIQCNDCAICLEVYRNGMSICGLPCGHNYHQNCIMLWLYRDNHCCPTCRWPTYKQKPKSV